MFYGDYYRNAHVVDCPYAGFYGACRMTRARPPAVPSGTRLPA